jgi:hypothetical protein
MKAYAAVPVIELYKRGQRGDMLRIPDNQPPEAAWNYKPR